ncbi:MAG: hypothetical protein NC415_11680 [bacterium]|nr:hypothetical protein [bacterium]
MNAKIFCFQREVKSDPLYRGSFRNLNAGCGADEVGHYLPQNAYNTGGDGTTALVVLADGKVYNSFIEKRELDKIKSLYWD